MTNQNIPYLCGGTFLTQILRARYNLTTPADHKDSKKESLSEQETFRRLISIYQLSDFYGGTSLKTYTSQFKRCTTSLAAYTLFSDNDRKRTFNEDVQNTDSIAMCMMVDFVRDFLNPSQWLQLIRCILDIVKNDSTIQEEDLFYIFAGGTAITAIDLQHLDHFYIEPFLLGIWHYIIMNRADDNEKGVDTYKQWYPSKSNYRGTIGNGITETILIDSLPKPKSHDKNSTDFNNQPRIEVIDANDDKNDAPKTHTQYIEHATIVNQNGKKNIHIDHVDTLNL